VPLPVVYQNKISTSVRGVHSQAISRIDLHQQCSTRSLVLGVGHFKRLRYRF